MLIQCHACNTKYRLNLEQIPKRKTFVRCKHCGTPIYIDPTEEGGSDPGAGVLPPQPEISKIGPDDGGPPVLPNPGMPNPGMVVCPNCEARYRLSPEILANPQAKLKCSQCSHIFVPPRPAPEPMAPERMDAEPMDFEPRAHAQSGSGGNTPGNGMPVPDEGRMEVLFDDLRPKEGVSKGEPPDDSSGRPGEEPDLGTLTDADFGDDLSDPDPDQAYLDAITFNEDGGDGSPAIGGTVPDEQKYKVFLNPDEFQGGEGTKGAPEPHDIDDGDLPPLDDLPAPPLMESPVSDPAASSQADLPALSEDLDQASDDSDSEHIREIRDEIPGQPPLVFTEKTALIILAAASVLVMLGAGVWGFWLSSAGEPNMPFSVQAGSPHNLVLEDNLNGRYVTNRSSGKRLFVVSGELENRFADVDAVRWIRIRGMAYADTDQARPLAQAFAYAGNTLDDSQLTHWELPAIKAYYGFINGRKDLNLEIPSGGKVPYQLVFTDMKEKVARTVAEVVSYRRKGQAVFIDTP